MNYKILSLLLFCSCSSLRQIERLPAPVVVWAKSQEFDVVVVQDGNGKLHSVRFDYSQAAIMETFEIEDTLK